MPEYTILLKRYETYMAAVTREAASAAAARAEVEATLATGGWDAVCDDDGDYEECWSDVVGVRPAGAREDVAGDLRALGFPACRVAWAEDCGSWGEAYAACDDAALLYELAGVIGLDGAAVLNRCIAALRDAVRLGKSFSAVDPSAAFDVIPDLLSWAGVAGHGATAGAACLVIFRDAFPPATVAAAVRRKLGRGEAPA